MWNASKELMKYRRKIDRMEKEKRRNNVVLQGIELEIEIDIKSARKLGNKICLVETKNAKNKEILMQNKNKLKHIKAKRI